MINWDQFLAPPIHSGVISARTHRTIPDTAESWNLATVPEHNNAGAKFVKILLMQITVQRTQKNARHSAEITEHLDLNFDDKHSFTFKCEVNPFHPKQSDIHNTNLLLDGATTHIINDKAKFVNFGKSFRTTKHIIELTYGSRLNNTVRGRGEATVTLIDTKGNANQTTSKNALYILTQHFLCASSNQSRC